MVGGVSNELRANRSLLKEIQYDIRKIFRRLPSSTVTGASPIQLTDLGEKIAKALGAVAWAEQMAGSLRDRVSGKRPDEIQEFCFTYVYDEYRPDSELERAINVSAYENGIDTSQILDVLAIVLRDVLEFRGA